MSTAKPRVLVVANGTATRMAPLTAEALRPAHAAWDLELVFTERSGHATELAAAAAAEGFDAVVAHGGDGTANQVANGVLGTATALGCLPAGRTNVFARSLGLPQDVQLALEHLVRSEPRTVDVGLANGRAFLFASGVGLSAHANRRFDSRPRLKRWLGPAFFAWSAVRALAEPELRHSPSVVVTEGERSVRGVTVIAQNAAALSYVGRRPVRICHESGLATGALSLAVLGRATALEALTVPPLLGLGRVLSHPRVHALTGVARARVAATDRRPLPLEVDGEYLGSATSVEYAAAPGALRVLA